MLYEDEIYEFLLILKEMVEVPETPRIYSHSSIERGQTTLSKLGKKKLEMQSLE